MNYKSDNIAAHSFCGKESNISLRMVPRSMLEAEDFAVDFAEEFELVLTTLLLAQLNGFG